MLIKEAKSEAGVEQDVELDVAALQALTERFKQLFADETGEEFPQEPREQLPRRSGLCSTPGWASGRSATGASTASRTTGARR